MRSAGFFSLAIVAAILGCQTNEEIAHTTPVVEGESLDSLSIVRFSAASCLGSSYCGTTCAKTATSPWAWKGCEKVFGSALEDLDARIAIADARATALTSLWDAVVDLRQLSVTAATVSTLASGDRDALQAKYAARLQSIEKLEQDAWLLGTDLLPSIKADLSLAIAVPGFATTVTYEHDAVDVHALGRTNSAPSENIFSVNIGGDGSGALSAVFTIDRALTELTGLRTKTGGARNLLGIAQRAVSEIEAKGRLGSGTIPDPEFVGTTKKNLLACSTLGRLESTIDKVEAAENGLVVALQYLDRMRELAVQCGNGVLSDANRELLQLEYRQYYDALSKLVASTSCFQQAVLAGASSTESIYVAQNNQTISASFGGFKTTSLAATELLKLSDGAVVVALVDTLRQDALARVDGYDKARAKLVAARAQLSK